MAILLSADGKTVETNQATLRRLAADKGDKIAFGAKQGAWAKYHPVTLNGRDVGKLFDSHEDVIKHLAGMARFKRTPSYQRLAAKKNPPKLGRRGRK